jgi:hypothetical protein
MIIGFTRPGLLRSRHIGAVYESCGARIRKYDSVFSRKLGRHRLLRYSADGKKSSSEELLRRFFCAAAPSAARSIASFAFAGVVSKNISIDSASVSWVESPHRSPLHHLCRELRRRIDVFVFAIYVLLPRRKLRRSRRLLLPPGKEQKLFEAKARHFPITLLSLSHAT